MSEAIPNLNQAPGNTSLDADEQAQLIPDLASKAELNEWERQNILEAYKWALSSRVLKREDPLIEPYIRELHKRMFGQTWKWAGKYRTSNKNLGTPFHEILNRIAALLGDAHYWIEHQTFDADEIAIRFHHRLVWIHPFPNGNGRHARLLSDVLAVKNGRDQFTWGSKELVGAGPARAEYIRCLQAADADNEDIQGLVTFARS
jgi:Fic-DOC domain mobile mystery protein B